MSNHGLFDPFHPRRRDSARERLLAQIAKDHRHRAWELKDRIEHLAKHYFVGEEPLREILNAILRSEPDRWLEQLYSLQPHVSGLTLTESGCNAIGTTGISPEATSARHTLIQLAQAVAQDDRARFDELSDQLRAHRARMSAARAELKALVSLIITSFYRRHRLKFLGRVEDACREARMELRKGLGYDLSRAGALLSRAALDAVEHWVNPDAIVPKFTSDGLLDSPAYRYRFPWRSWIMRGISGRANTKKTPNLPVIWSHGGRSYSRDGDDQVVVTVDEDEVLTAFLKHGRVMDTAGLESATSVSNIPRVIKQLTKRYGGRFADAIHTPGGRKNAGGYFIRVRSAHEG